MMHAEFWLEKWRKGETGFHLAEAHPLLQRHWPALKLAPGAPVFVPLCGKSRDMAYLGARGHEVIGIELSELAIDQFLTETGIVTREGERDGMPARMASGWCLIIGDVFRLTPASLDAVAVVYDRAALVAMPPPLQLEYVRHLRAVVPATASMMVITLDYDPAEMAGPPFAVPAGRLRTLFGDCYEVRLLERVDALDDNPGLRDRGLTALEETAWLLVPR